ncbi:hypothetical protein LRP30_22115 [Bradyrhizobium sp. C-145]|uniref:hypothetical protein n=1 Tax=Bradyrhizobium sp. C-145 TaxID=574727 RepID=UPI00201B7D78|nr:hypothetical protein [Bradyrhizobium sp. C-145]UQR67783.1 hypothetical protein LRP30_22115 [Bradyrhizobium sp. C-145]
MVAPIAKNVHWFGSLDDASRQLAACIARGIQPETELSVEGLLSGTGIGCHQKRSLLSTGDE